jgi:hypothetical protein
MKLRDGLLHEENRQTRDELARFGTRKPHVMASLPRDHVINKYLGIFLPRLNLR